MAIEYIDVARRCANRFARLYSPRVSRLPLDRDDFFSAALEYLVTVAMQFRPSLHVPFEAYAVEGICGRLRNLVRDERRQNGWVLNGRGYAVPMCQRVELPPWVDAVDPVEASSREPSTRVNEKD